MTQLLHDLQPFAVILIAAVVALFGWAAKGWLRSAIAPIYAKLEGLGDEIVNNREAAQNRDAEHSKELGMLSEALRGLKEAFERQAATHDSLQGQVNRAVFAQGKHDERLAALDGRLERVERRCDIVHADELPTHRRRPE